MRATIAAAALLLSLPLLAQEPSTDGTGQWFFKERLEIRADYRDSKEAKFKLAFRFPPEFLPVGQSDGFLETVNAGRHVELNVGQVRLDMGYGNIFMARAQVHFQDKDRRNPTSEDRKLDADELFVRLGENPEFLQRPEGTSFFLQAGKFPKMERQPIRLLESYGLAATSFNRFEDVGFMTGGTVGRSFYWRAQVTSGNPVYFRDSNALAGDNGIKELLTLHPDPRLKSGFPILYNAETEGYFLRTENMQVGEGVGYRWQRADAKLGFDAIAFHYKRTMADQQKLTGTFYGADIDLLNGPEGPGIVPNSLPISGRRKEETGGRIYAEWHRLTTTAQYTKQVIAGLHRQGYELESGYEIPVALGPSIGGESFLRAIQPVVRVSGIENGFRGTKTFIDPSMWWNWTKIDLGVRITFAKRVDITVEHAKHNIVAPAKIDLGESLVTLRIRI